MVEKSDMELLLEILEESRLNHLKAEIQLEYFKVQSIAFKDPNIPTMIKNQEKMIENDKIWMRILRSKIKDLQEDKGGNN